MSKITTELQELLNAIYAAGLCSEDEDVSTLLHELFSDDKDHLYGKEKQAALKDFGYLHIESEDGGEGAGGVMKESIEDFCLRSSKEFYTLQVLIAQTLAAAKVYNNTMVGRVGSGQSTLLVNLLDCVKSAADKPLL